MGVIVDSKVNHHDAYRHKQQLDQVISHSLPQCQCGRNVIRSANRLIAQQETSEW